MDTHSDSNSENESENMGEPNLDEILNNFNLKNDNVSNIINDLSKGDIGNVMKQFTDVISKHANKQSANVNVTQCDDDDKEDTDNRDTDNKDTDNRDTDNKDTDNNDDFSKIFGNSLDGMDEMDDEDFEVDLSKYFLSKNGQNICDVLIDIKSELVNINNSINNSLNK